MSMKDVLCFVLAALIAVPTSVVLTHALGAAGVVLGGMNAFLLGVGASALSDLWERA